MKVKQLMTVYAPACRNDRTIAEVERDLLSVDAGPFPVVDREGRVLGVLRKSDIRQASNRFGRVPEHIPVVDAMLRDIRPCLPSDDVDVALARMRASRLSRLPVVDVTGKLVGAVSIVDPHLENGDEGLETVENLGGIHEPTVADHRSPSYLENGS